MLEGTDETAARWDVHPLARLTALFEECAAAVPDEAGNLLVVSDAQGVLLWIQGDPRVRHDAADSMNFAEGTLWSEGGTGTNAIGTALAADHAVQVFAAEHFNEVVQAWTCAAAPIHDPETGELLGVVDLTSRMSRVHPYSLALAVSTARAAEAQLSTEMHLRDIRLRARYEQRVTQGPDARALVTPRGRVLMQHPHPWLARHRGGAAAARRRGARAAERRVRVRRAGRRRRRVRRAHARRAHVAAPAACCA